MYSFLDAAHTVMRSVFSLNHLHNVQLLPVKLLLWLLLWEADVTLKGTFSSLSWSWSKQLSELSPIMTHALLSPALNLSTVQTLQDTVTRHCRTMWPDSARSCDQTLRDTVTRTQLDCSPTAAPFQWNSLQPDTSLRRKFCSSKFCSDIWLSVAVSVFPAFSCCSV